MPVACGSDFEISRFIGKECWVSQNSLLTSVAIKVWTASCHRQRQKKYEISVKIHIFSTCLQGDIAIHWVLHIKSRGNSWLTNGKWVLERKNTVHGSYFHLHVVWHVWLFWKLHTQMDVQWLSTSWWNVPKSEWNHAHWFLCVYFNPLTPAI